jgi:hypothetical protein
MATSSNTLNDLYGPKTKDKDVPEERCLVMSAQGDVKGWLMVTLEKKGIVQIPYGLKVMWEGIKDRREYFTILEGVYKGCKGSVSVDSKLNKSRFDKTIVHQPSGRIKIDLAQQALWYGGNGPFNAFSGGNFTSATGGKKIKYTPIPKGTYNLRIPDYPHVIPNGGRDYGKFTQYKDTWFCTTAIGNDSTYSRYLHPGELSDGCVTVRFFNFDPKKPIDDPHYADFPRIAKEIPGFLGFPAPDKQYPFASWDDIYNYLILRRVSNYGQYVGILDVV